MFEGSMKSFGWGYVGSNVKGFGGPGHRKAIFMLLLSEWRCLQE